MEREKTLFVFYTLGEKSETWHYGNFPKNWWWVGAGSTAAHGEPKKQYEREEQFSGPASLKKEMHDYLHDYFTELKDKKIIKIFKIRSTYSP